LAADVNVGMNITNRITGLAGLQALKRDLGGVEKQVRAETRATKVVRNETKAYNKILGVRKGFYAKLKPAQLNNIMQLQRQKTAALAHGMTVSEMNVGLKRRGQALDENGNLMWDTGKSIKNQDMAWSKLKGSTKRFRMELLSVMFFGMAIQRTFMSLIKTSLNWSGAIDILSSALGILFLPAGEKLTDWSIDFLDKVDKLSEGEKKLASTTAMSGVAFGGLLTVYGVVGLGILGLAKATAGWGVALKWLWAIGAKGSPWFAKLSAWVMILWGAFRGIAGYLKGDWYRAFTGVLIAVGGAVALYLGGWIPAGIALIIGGVLALGDEFKWLKNIIMTIISPLSYLFSLVLNLGDTLRTGEWKGFWGRVHDIGKIGTYWEGEQPETKMARGGIVTSPTRALIGEAGPEAVIPLTGGVGGGAGIGGLVYSPTITINANVANDIDINSLGTRLNDILYTELRRLGVR